MTSYKSDYNQESEYKAESEVNEEEPKKVLERSAEYFRLEKDFQDALLMIQVEYACVRKCFIDLRDLYNKEKGDVPAEEKKKIQNSKAFQDHQKDFENDL